MAQCGLVGWMGGRWLDPVRFKEQATAQVPPTSGLAVCLADISREYKSGSAGTVIRVHVCCVSYIYSGTCIVWGMCCNV